MCGGVSHECVRASARMSVSVYPWMCLWVWMSICEEGYVCTGVCLCGGMSCVCACVCVCVLWLRSQKACVTLMESGGQTSAGGC